MRRCILGCEVQGKRPLILTKQIKEWHKTITYRATLWPDSFLFLAFGPALAILHVRRGLEALIRRPVFYQLVEMAEERDTPEGPVLGIGSNGAWFPLGPAGIHLA